MRIHFTSRNAAFFVAGGLVAALFVSGAAHAITDTVFRYSSVKTGYYGLSPLSFVPVDHVAADRYADVAAGGIQSVQLTNGGTSACFNTGVNLPQGAKMTSFAMWYSSDRVDGVGATLIRAKLADGSDDVIATIDSTNANQIRAHRTVTPASATATVDNAQYVYSVIVCLVSTIQESRYYAGRITYTYATAGD